MFAPRLQDQEYLQHNQKVPTLSSWNSSFTDFLLSSSRKGCDPNGENRDDAFILLDNVMGSESWEQPPQIGGGNYNHINTSKGVKTSDFCDNLTREIDPFLKKLKPARTQGDHRADEILKLLQSMGTHFPDTQSQSLHQSKLLTSVESDERVRGDNIVFISREYRQQKSFPEKHPYLHRLISSITNTFDREFGCSKDNNIICSDKDSIQLDFSMTSVQLALYPGDSKSGYRRHCDRQHSCLQEATETGIKTPGNPRKSSASQINMKPERFITCIYYLTDDDWDTSQNGGALRLFRPGTSNGDHTNSSSKVGLNYLLRSYTDVVPFRDRMVVFRSDRVEHQVMPSHRRQRLAITMWFYGVVPKRNPGKNIGIPTDVAADGSDSKAANAVEPTPIAMNGSRTILPLPIHGVSSPSKLTTPSMAVPDDTDDSSQSIFVSIASYRDSETRPTIDALYSTAHQPERIFTGVVAQLIDGEKDDEDIWASITGTNEFKSASKPWTSGPNQLRVIRLHARDATGPCYARGLCQSLYRGEDYVLQIDSHMRFRPNWDEYLIQTTKGLQDQRRKMSAGDELDHCDKIMLTTYPIGYTLPNNVPNETRGTYLVPWKFDAQGMMRQRGRIVRKRSAGPTTQAEKDRHGSIFDSDTRKARTEATYPAHAHRQFLYAGGFNFGPSRIIRDVPYDTMGLHHLFFGEELSMAVRLFTHGYDLYAPEEAVCYHLWSRAHRPTNPSAAAASTPKTGAKNSRLKELSRAKVQKQLLGDEAMIGAHCGLGEARTAAIFAEHLRVNFERKTFICEGWDCGELTSEEFVGQNRNGTESLFPADSVESKVASLDSSTQTLIGMFLQGL